MTPLGVKDHINVMVRVRGSISESHYEANQAIYTTDTVRCHGNEVQVPCGPMSPLLNYFEILDQGQWTVIGLGAGASNYSM